MSYIITEFIDRDIISDDHVVNADVDCKKEFGFL